jgi:hypothetical protein
MNNRLLNLAVLYPEKEVKYNRYAYIQSSSLSLTRQKQHLNIITLPTGELTG